MARANFEHRMIRKAQAASSVLSHLPTWIWKCDPPPSKHVENETYIQFTELLQVKHILPISCKGTLLLITVHYPRVT